MRQRDSEGMAIRASAPARMRPLGVLSTLLLVLCLSSASQPAEAEKLARFTSVTAFTDEAVLLDGCESDDLAMPETFEELVGGAVETPDGLTALGFPEAPFEFPSQIVYCDPDPNADQLALVDLAKGRTRYTLGTNGDIASFACEGGDNAGDSCEDNDDCTGGSCEPQITLPSGSSYAATTSRFAESVRFALPTSDSACRAVGMFLSSFDGAEVTLTLFDEERRVIGRSSFATESALEGFIGVVANSAFRSVEISSTEVYAFDDIYHSISNSMPAVSCPEPDSATLGLAAIASLAALSARRRRSPCQRR